MSNKPHSISEILGGKRGRKAKDSDATCKTRKSSKRRDSKTNTSSVRKSSKSSKEPKVKRTSKR